MTTLLPDWLFAYLAIGALLVAASAATAPPEQVRRFNRYPTLAVAIAILLTVLLWPLAFLMDPRR